MVFNIIRVIHSWQYSSKYWPRSNTACYLWTIDQIICVCNYHNECLSDYAVHTQQTVVVDQPEAGGQSEPKNAAWFDSSVSKISFIPWIQQPTPWNVYSHCYDDDDAAGFPFADRSASNRHKRRCQL